DATTLLINKNIINKDFLVKFSNSLFDISSNQNSEPNLRQSAIETITYLVTNDFITKDIITKDSLVKFSNFLFDISSNQNSNLYLRYFAIDAITHLINKNIINKDLISKDINKDSLVKFSNSLFDISSNQNSNPYLRESAIDAIAQLITK